MTFDKGESRLHVSFKSSKLPKFYSILENQVNTNCLKESTKRKKALVQKEGPSHGDSFC